MKMPLSNLREIISFKHGWNKKEIAPLFEAVFLSFTYMFKFLLKPSSAKIRSFLQCFQGNCRTKTGSIIFKPVPVPVLPDKWKKKCLDLEYSLMKWKHNKNH